MEEAQPDAAVDARQPHRVVRAPALADDLREALREGDALAAPPDGHRLARVRGLLRRAALARGQGGRAGGLVRPRDQRARGQVGPRGAEAAADQREHRRHHRGPVLRRVLLHGLLH